MIKYKNSSIYVQRQIDRILKSFDFVRVYVDNIVIFSEILNNYMKHLHAIFQILIKNNISINYKKTFLNYSFITLLKQDAIFLKKFYRQIQIASYNKYKIFVYF